METFEEEEEEEEEGRRDSAMEIIRDSAPPMPRSRWRKATRGGEGEGIGKRV